MKNSLTWEPKRPRGFQEPPKLTSIQQFQRDYRRKSNAIVRLDHWYPGFSHQIFNTLGQRERCLILGKELDKKFFESGKKVCAAVERATVVIIDELPNKPLGAFDLFSQGALEQVFSTCQQHKIPWILLSLDGQNPATLFEKLITRMFEGDFSILEIEVPHEA